MLSEQNKLTSCSTWTIGYPSLFALMSRPIPGFVRAKKRSTVNLPQIFRAASREYWVDWGAWVWTVRFTICYPSGNSNSQFGSILLYLSVYLAIICHLYWTSKPFCYMSVLFNTWIHNRSHELMASSFCPHRMMTSCPTFLQSFQLHPFSLNPFKLNDSQSLPYKQGMMTNDLWQTPEATYTSCFQPWTTNLRLVIFAT